MAWIPDNYKRSSKDSDDSVFKFLKKKRAKSVSAKYKGLKVIASAIKGWNK